VNVQIEIVLSVISTIIAMSAIFLSIFSYRREQKQQFARRLKLSIRSGGAKKCTLCEDTSMRNCYRNT